MPKATAKASDAAQTEPLLEADAKRLSAAYDELAKRTRLAVEEASNRSGVWIEQALERAGDELEQAGKITAEEARKLGQSLLRDLKVFAREIEDVGDDLRKRFSTSKTRTAMLDLAAHLLAEASESIRKLGGQADEALTVHTGEITGPGKAVCLGCGFELHFDETGRVPPCPKCRGTEFRKTL